MQTRQLLMGVDGLHPKHDCLSHDNWGRSQDMQWEPAMGDWKTQENDVATVIFVKLVKLPLVVLEVGLIFCHLIWGWGGGSTTK